VQDFDFKPPRIRIWLKKVIGFPFRPGMTASVDIITTRKENVSVGAAGIGDHPESEKR
jgi:hypothetical protein